MRKLYLLWFIVMLACFSCEWHLRPTEHSQGSLIGLERYDQIEALFLTTGDVAALHQMNTDYPDQTRMLIENLLQIGHVDDAEINSRFFHYYQDTTLQTIIKDVKHQYEDLSDIEQALSESFARLQTLIPEITIPKFYTQISSLDQSIVVYDGCLGISLDKYLGSDYPIYIKYGYSERQRKTMTRSYIVPDCLSFYLLSLYPIAEGQDTVRAIRDKHMGRIQYIVNKVLNDKKFQNEFVLATESYMKQHPNVSIVDLLEQKD